MLSDARPWTAPHCCAPQHCLPGPFLMPWTFATGHLKSDEIRLSKNPEKNLRKAWTFWRISCNIGFPFVWYHFESQYRRFFCFRGDFYISSHMDNPRFGVKDWDEAKQAKKPEYDFGQMLSQAADIAKPVPCQQKGYRVPKLRQKNSNKICWNLKLEVNKTLDCATKLLLLAFWVHLLISSSSEALSGCVVQGRSPLAFVFRYQILVSHKQWPSLCLWNDRWLSDSVFIHGNHKNLNLVIDFHWDVPGSLEQFWDLCVSASFWVQRRSWTLWKWTSLQCKSMNHQNYGCPSSE